MKKPKRSAAEKSTTQRPKNLEPKQLEQVNGGWTGGGGQWGGGGNNNQITPSSTSQP
jgi:hypothetical protein